MESTGKIYTLSNWDNDKDKDNLAHYADPQFRWAYMTEKMLPKSRACELLIQDQIWQLVLRRTVAMYRLWPNQSFVMTPTGAAIRSETDAGSFVSPTGITLRILSLGCGPGTDLLAAIRACLLAGGVTTIMCVGVDKYPWPQDEFKKQLESTVASSHPTADVRVWLYQTDYSVLINDCTRAGWQFDLVISCYAGAKDYLDLLGRRVPLLLSEFGRAFIIDNSNRRLSDGLCAMGYVSMAVREGLVGKLMFLVYAAQARKYAVVRPYYFT